MVTSNLILDSQIVTVGVGSASATGPSSQQTTYLLNQFGHTTAVVPLSPTVVSDITPAPRPSTAASSRTALPSTGTGGVPSGWYYIGCYIDYPNARVFPMQLPNNTLLTPHKCVSSCYQLGYSIAGLKYRRECFCGNAIYNGGSLALSQSDCNMTCSGNRMEVCGAQNRSSIYSNGSVNLYHPEVVQTSRPTTTTPNITPSPTGSTSQTPRVDVTVAAVFGGVAIMVALVYLCWRLRNCHRTKSPRQTSRNTARARTPADPVPSWEDLSKGNEEYNAKFDESMMTFRDGNRSGLDPESLHAEHRPSILELRKRYELQLNNRQVHLAGSNSSHKYAASPTKYTPPTRLAIQGQLGQPTSILKRPATPEITNMAQGTLELEDAQVSKITGNLARAKKGVRFGVNQIRQFGRSPFIGSGSDSSVSSP